LKAVSRAGLQGVIGEELGNGKEQRAVREFRVEEVKVEVVRL